MTDGRSNPVQGGTGGGCGAARGRSTFGRVGLVLGLLLSLASTAQAEPQRVEVVGTYPIRESMRGKVNPRDEAIQKALWEGVSRVALELIGEESDSTELEPAESPPGGGPAAGETREPDATARFRKLFGREILPYTRSFRIVEDRGERPVLFADEPGVRSEYLVVVEVMVDVDRVTSELARAGLVAAPSGPGVSQSVTIELVGIDRWAGLRLVLDTLERALSATRVETLEFSAARQLLRLEGPHGPDEVAARLGRLESAELILDPVEVDPQAGRIRVLAQWLEPEPVEPEAPLTAEPSAPASLPR